VAFGGKKPEYSIAVGPQEIRTSFEKLTTTQKEEIDLVCFGCPHCSLPQIREIASLLEGKKIHENTRLWVATSGHLKDIAQRMGLVEIIEKAGGLVTTDLCVAPGAYFIPGACNVDVIFGGTRDCIQAALKGQWRRSK
jgi:predicted aconitase